MHSCQDTFGGTQFDNLGISDSLQELSLSNSEQAYVVYWIKGPTFGLLHSLESFVLDMLKLICTETILVIKKAFLPGHYNIFFVLYLIRPQDFCLNLEIWQGPRKESKSIKLNGQVAHLEEADR